MRWSLWEIFLDRARDNTVFIDNLLDTTAEYSVGRAVGKTVCGKEPHLIFPRFNGPLPYQTPYSAR